VIIHPLTDHRRLLTIDKASAKSSKQPMAFLLVVSYNPGYQNVLKISSTARDNASSLWSFIFRIWSVKPKLSLTNRVWTKENAAQLAKLGHKVRNCASTA